MDLVEATKCICYIEYQFGCGILKMVGPKELGIKVRFWHFLTNHNSSQDCFKTISFEHVDSWAKILHFRTHHL